MRSSGLISLSIMLALVAQTLALAGKKAGFAGIFRAAKENNVINANNNYDNKLTWRMQKVGGSYSNPSMKIAVIAVENFNFCDLQPTEAAAASLLSGSCTVLNSAESARPRLTNFGDGACLDLHVDASAAESTFTIDVGGITRTSVSCSMHDTSCRHDNAPANFAVYTEHAPSDFVQDTHYLQLASTGADLHPDGGVLPWLFPSAGAFGGIVEMGDQAMCMMEGGCDLMFRMQKVIDACVHEDRALRPRRYRRTRRSLYHPNDGGYQLRTAVPGPRCTVCPQQHVHCPQCRRDTIRESRVLSAHSGC